MKLKLIALILILSGLVIGVVAVVGSGSKITSLPIQTFDVDPYLGIPAVVEHPNNKFLQPYFAIRKGLRVKYINNIFSTNMPDLIWVPEVTSQGKVLLRWQTSEKNSPGLVGIFPGQILQVVDDKLYDFGVGTLFVKVYSESYKATGYTLLETIIGETEPVDDVLWKANDVKKLVEKSTLSFEGMVLYAILLPGDRNVIIKYVDDFNHPETYEKTLNGSQPNGVHPVVAANAVYSTLLFALLPTTSDDDKQKMIASAENFFKHYVIPNKVEIAPGIISWPYKFEWNVNWGIKISPPWYSAYANGTFANAAALLYRLTKNESYKTLAIQSADFLGYPITKGGAEFDVSGFKLPAEYVYNTPPLPNIDIIDGEFIALTTLYNTARLLGDSHLLNLFMKQAASLSMQLSYFEQPNGNLYFSRYIEEMPLTYKWLMWSNLQAFANIMKDRRLLIVAQKLHPNIPEDWAKMNGN
jgi:hypothetical protein